MMRAKILGTVVAAFAAIVAMTATTESRAGDESLVNVTCAGGNLTATAKDGWHVNPKAPWKWDQGTKVSVDDTTAKFKGNSTTCGGTLQAYICTKDASKCLGPIPIAVK
jgi:hypothetical protein